MFENALATILQVVALLAMATVCVAISVRLRLGTIIGYLVCGLLVGPGFLGILPPNQLVSLLAQFGVVFLLFAIGLELPLARLRAIGLRSFLLAIAQILAGVAVGTGAALAAGVPPAGALVIGFGLSLSSTAVVVPFLVERGELATRFGRTAFAVLLLQDVAFGPMLILTLALGRASEAPVFELARTLLLGLGFGGLALFFGPRLLDRALRAIVASGPHELFVATTLAIGMGAAAVTDAVGLSLALGGLLCGMVLADTAYRHQVAATIRPFSGLLVGLFFVTVAFELDLALSPPTWLAVLAGALVLLLVKGASIFPVAIALGYPKPLALRLSIVLAQAGEYAFVLWPMARDSGLLAAELVRPLELAAAIGLAVTPLLARVAIQLGETPSPTGLPDAEAAAPPEAEEAGHVIVVGAGRVGTQVAEMLREAGIRTVGIDVDANRVQRARVRGLPFYYGNVVHPEVLESLHIEKAAALVLAIDDMAAARQAAALVRYLFPELPLFVRVLDESEAETYRRLDATVVVPEVIETGRHLAAATLRCLADRKREGDSRRP
ncbi:Glutathione-regulated potassium-efflux system protein KefC [bacterium HR40]|nr:Glutathione-regulated potassium-efflux system protein KefC [bacterium HR40]